MSEVKSLAHGESPAYLDSTWHWVKYDDTEAPAMYLANVDCWYSYQFGGIPTRQLEVLGPCSRLAEQAQEIERLRSIISDCAKSCGAAVSVECSLDFMAHLPVEIAAVISSLREDRDSQQRVCITAMAELAQLKSRQLGVVLPERAAFEVEIPEIAATFDGLYLIPVIPLKAGEHLMTIEQHLRIEKQLRAALSAPSHSEQVDTAQGEAVQIEVVAVTREDGDGELYLDWTLEGGISALEFAGQNLLVAHGDVTGEDGSGVIYTAPPAIPAAQVLVDTLENLHRKYAQRSSGLLDSGAPEHVPTIAISELLSGYLPDDREDHWEAIQAYADQRAAMALSSAILSIKGGDV